jgi:DhnA family fructose-bisphosphate aldolase class Ia
MDEVAGATTLPILMLGGEPGHNPDDTFGLWEESMKQPNVRGLVAGRALLYPHDGDAEAATTRASAVVRSVDSPNSKGSS